MVYLSNAVEKYCKETNFNHKGIYRKWASYGFVNGILKLDEYYPNALIDTYKGVSGYIYYVADNKLCEAQSDIPFAYTSKHSIKTENCEFIQDAYEEILKAENEGKIIIQRYEENSAEKLKWIKEIIIEDYVNAVDSLDYRYFLKAKFPEALSLY
ncbi:MAG: hypothetical protein RSE93_07065 [Oscillospiraceae bacterium]